MKTRVFLCLLAWVFGWLVYALPKDYRPAGRAFLFSIINNQLDCEVSVPREILGTIATAVLNAIDPYSQPSYEEAVEILNQYKERVLVQINNYPPYRGVKLPNYNRHPHYYVMGAFCATPFGDGTWLIQDRYDWHFPAAWSLPDCIARFIPGWILSKFCSRYDGQWYLEEIGVLDRLTVPYWHKSVIKLSDYLSPDTLDHLRCEEEEDDWLI